MRSLLVCLALVAARPVFAIRALGRRDPSAAPKVF